jgi:putative flippase GtrA
MSHSSVGRRLHLLLLSPAARPLRFAGTGVTAGAVQLGLLLLLTHAGIDSLIANSAAFLLAAQLNFILSMAITWPERRGTAPLARRWLTFHCSIAAMAVLNLIVFTLARDVVSAPQASALGIAAGALGNYLAGDRLVFRSRNDDPTATAQRSYAA